MPTYEENKIILHLLFFCCCLFAADDVKMNDLQLHFSKVFRYNCFCEKPLLWVLYCNLYVRKDLLERYL